MGALERAMSDILLRRRCSLLFKGIVVFVLYEEVFLSFPECLNRDWRIFDVFEVLSTMRVVTNLGVILKLSRVQGSFK